MNKMRILAISSVLGISVAANAVVITQSVSQTLVAGSVSCNSGGITSDNGYSRGFTLASHGITQPFQVSAVQFGVEQATAGAGNGGQQAVTVNIYDGFTTSGSTLTYGALAGTTTGMVADGSLFMQTMNVNGLITSGLLAVEIFVADSTGAGGDGDSFFIGSNALGQTGPGYIRSIGCGLPNNTQLGAIGFPNMHMVINVEGTAVPEPASMAVLGAGALALIRRRRSK